MSTVIRHKRGTNNPAASDFSETAELLVNTTDGGLFTKTDGGSVVEVGKADKEFFSITNSGTTAGTWLGSHSDISAYFDGMTIAFYQNDIAGASTTTININSLGAKTIYYANDNKLTTHYGKRALIMLQYDSQQDRFYAHDFYYQTDDYRMRWQNDLIAGAQINGYTLLMQGIDGKMYPVTPGGVTTNSKTVSTAELRVGGLILHYENAATYSADAVMTGNHNYASIFATTMENWHNYDSGWATTDLPWYIVCTMNSNGNFVLDNSSFTSFLTQTLPTSDDDKFYIMGGWMHNTHDQYRLQIDHPIYVYKNGAIRMYSGYAGFGTDIGSGNSKAEIIDTGTDGRFIVTTEGSERLKVDSSGRLLVGTTDSISVNGQHCAVQVEGATTESSRISVINRGNNASGGGIQIAKSRGTIPHNVANNDQVGGIFFCAADGNDFDGQAARIECYIEGLPGGDDTPGRLTFSTTPDQTNSPIERMRLTSSGNLGIANTSPGQALTVGNGTADTRMSINSTSQYQLEFNNGTSDGFFIGSPGANSLAFAQNNGTTRLKIDSSGNLGLKTSSPSSYYAADLVVSSSAEGGITIAGPSTGQSYLAFADGTSGNARYRGYIAYDHATDSLKLASGASERLKIDSSGVVTIGGNTAWHAGNDGSGSGLDADTLDGVQASSLLRSDAADTKTSGHLTFNDNIQAQFGSSADLKIYHDGTNSYLTETGTGNLILQTSRFEVTNAGGTENIINSVENGSIELYYDGSKKFETAGYGAKTTGNHYFTGWIENTDTGEGLYNQGTESHFFSASANYWHIDSGNGLVFYDGYTTTANGATNRKGLVYHDVNGFGLLDSNGSWRVRTQTTGVQLYGTLTRDATHTIWDAGNDGSGSGLDADTLDGVQGANYLRSDQSDTMSGSFTATGDMQAGGNPDNGTAVGTRSNSNGSHQACGGDDNVVVYEGYRTNNSNPTFKVTAIGNVTASGSITASGNVTAYSDITLKKNIEVIPNALDKVMQLRGVTFDRKDIETSRQSGVIAQEIEKVLPEVVDTNEEGIKSVAYGNLVGLLIEAIKEQQVQIKELKTLVNLE